MKKSALRWIPAVAIPAVVVAGAIAVPSFAGAAVHLPAKSALGIVSLAQKSAGTSFSGTVSETANLGLPDVSSSALGGGAEGSSASDALAQLTGTHEAKVYVSGTDAARVQTLDDLQERDVIRDGRTVWSYDSKANTVTHVTLPQELPRHASPQAASPTTGAMATPSDVATSVLADVKKYTAVTTSDSVRVAGRTAYGITLRPKTDDTLVGSVTLDIDSATGVPLRAVVMAKGQKAPAFQVGFTKIDFSKPAASTFEFTPPKGATVKKVTVPAPDASGSVHPGALTQEGAAATATKRAEAKAKYDAIVAKYDPTVIGSGWSTIVGAALPSGTSGESGQGAEALDQLLTPVDGGRVLQTALISVLLTDDGHVYVGAVTAKSLEQAVASAK